MNKIITIALMCMISAAAVANESFPGRTTYPKVPYIELDNLYKQRDKVVIIDARSPYEYETLRIKGAVSVPLVLSSKLFGIEVHNIRQKYPDRKLVFYCNGHSCMKSYKAARRAIVYLGLDNVYAFDAGIFDWASKYPMEAMLLGKVLDDPAKLISKDKFKSHLLEAEKFINNKDDTAIILDIRDRIERDGFYVFSRYEKSISLNAKDNNIMDRFFSKVKKE